MIVISGALVLVALVLLVIGLVSTSLPFVYASIAVSVVSFVFLIIGILQRRGEQLPDVAPAGEPAGTEEPVDAEAVTAVVRSDRRPAETVAASTAAAAVSGSVLVVAGRPRYHVGGCRYLNGKDPDEVPASQARADGFTACGVCKPDDVLAQEAAAQPHPQPDDEPLAVSAEEADPASDDAQDIAAPAPATRGRATKAPAKAPAKRAAATKAPAKKAATKAPAKAPAKAPVKAPVKAATAASKPAAVVVIPDRDKFHTPGCRFVRDSADAQELTRAQAARQGYAACGVCKP